MLRTLFNKLTGKPVIPQNHLLTRDVNLLLVAHEVAEAGGTISRRVQDARGNYAEFTLKGGRSGEILELDMLIHRNGHDYKTTFKADQQDGLCIVKELVFDNIREPLVTAQETYLALNYIGNQIRQMRGVAGMTPRVPFPHNKKDFGMMRRLAARLMA